MSGPTQVHAHEPWNKPCDETCPGWRPSRARAARRPGPLTTFPLSIVVFCDRCGIEAEHDYVVHDLMTREERLGVARTHLTRNEGWSCTAEGDFCPVHKPEASV